MVSPDHSGKGVGRALGQHVIEQLRADGLERAKMFSWLRTTKSTLMVFDQICPETVVGLADMLEPTSR